MSTVQIWGTNSTSSEATEQLGEQLGKHLKGREVIELASDLGGGKTTFVRGLARGAGSLDKVSSPTFTISKVYKTPTLEIHHFDFYRLPEAGLIAYELADSLDDPSITTVVEWGAIVDSVLPEERLRIRFDRTPKDSRHITVEYPASLSYLMEGL